METTNNQQSKRRWELEYLLNCLKCSPLIGEKVSINKHGEGVIQFQNTRLTRVDFSRKIVTFDAHEIGSSFFKGPTEIDIQNELAQIEKNDLGEPPVCLMEKLIQYWKMWNLDVDNALVERAPALMKYPWIGMDQEWKLFKELKKKIDRKDWDNLPLLLASVYHGQVPDLVHNHYYEAVQAQEMIKAQVRQEINEALLKNTVEIANRIVAHQEEVEKEEAEKRAKRERTNAFIRSLNERFRKDFFATNNLILDEKSLELISGYDLRMLRMQYARNWFSEKNLEKTQPDSEQLEAICAPEKNIEVVARAGSGKTTTIVNRFFFLTEHCKVDPSSILMLAFNKKAVEELRARTDRMLINSGKTDGGKPHILTFHALAHSIVHPAERLIYDEGESGSNALSKTVQAIIDKRLIDIIWRSRIRRIMIDYFKNDWERIVEGHFHLSIEEQLLYRRSMQNQSLKGDYVKSYGEKLISNILFEHDIDYVYERPFKWGDEYYRPDFSVKLPESKWLIIEYFGLAGKADYDEQIDQKRQYWSRKENCTLYELYPADIVEGEECVVSKLRELFEAYHVPFNKLSDEEIWKRIEKRAIDAFTKTVTSFIGRCRKKDLSIDELREMVKEYQTENTTEKLFLSVCGSIYKEYLHKLSAEHLEDFDGLISRACKAIQDGQTDYDKRELRASLEALSFIMVDEYQDFSYLFDKLLESIRSVCPDACIFCVGDDWQAINGFAGSDVTYFQDFVRRYKDSGKYAIRTNYRSASSIVNAGTHLMSCGTEDEGIRPYSTSRGNVAIAYYDLLDLSLEERDVFQSDVLTPAVLRLVAHFLRQKKRVVLLFRTNERLPINAKIPAKLKGNLRERFTDYIKTFFPASQRDWIQSSTTHQYKGKESDAIIIVDAITSFYPLIHPTWTFMQIFGDSLDKLVEDERRLFYVAVTRAKSDLVILTTIQDESPFLDQLGSIGTLQWNTLPPFDTGKRKTRIEVRSQPGFGSSPTYSIRKELRDSGFDFDRKTLTWFRFCEPSFDLHSIIDEPWVSKANHVQITFYDEHGEEKGKLQFSGEEIIDLMPSDSSEGNA